MITLSIDVTQLDKARFKEVTRKNGKKAIFCDLVLFEHQSEHGDYLIKQAVTKEERAARKEMPIIGNAKIWESNKLKQPTKVEPKSDDVGDDGLPF